MTLVKRLTCVNDDPHPLRWSFSQRGGRTPFVIVSPDVRDCWCFPLAFEIPRPVELDVYRSAVGLSGSVVPPDDFSPKTARYVRHGNTSLSAAHTGFDSVPTYTVVSPPA